jgi:signal transduction histidine kinase
MAHEINTPLGYLGANLNAASGYVADVQAFAGELATATALTAVRAVWQGLDLDASLADFQELLAQSQSGLKQIGRIVNDLRTFSRIDSTARIEPFEVNAAIEATVRVLAPQGLSAAPIRLALQDLPALTGDRAAFQQALYNLMQNGLQALGEGGELEVSSRLEPGQILVQINDNGTKAIGVAKVVDGGTVINIEKIDGSNWTAAVNTNGVEGAMTLEIR